MLSRAPILACVAVIGACAALAPPPAAAQVASAVARPSAEAVKTVLHFIGAGASNPGFTDSFNRTLTEKGPQIRSHLAEYQGTPRAVRPMGDDRYMAYYTRGFVEWQLSFAPDGRVSGAVYRITDNPGTPGRTAVARDQRDVFLFWDSVGQAAATYVAQEEARRYEEMLWTSQVLADIREGGGYQSQGYGVGATGSIVSEDMISAAERDLAQAGFQGSSSRSSGTGSSGFESGGATGAGGQGSISGGSTSSSASASSTNHFSDGTPHLTSSQGAGSGSGSGSWTPGGYIIVEQAPPPPPPPPQVIQPPPRSPTRRPSPPVPVTNCPLGGTSCVRQQ